MEKIKIVIIGAGVRGRYTYGDFIKNNQETCEVVAVVENKIGRRKKFKEIFSLPDDKVFANINDFFEKEKLLLSSVCSTMQPSCSALIALTPFFLSNSTYSGL